MDRVGLRSSLLYLRANDRYWNRADRQRHPNLFYMAAQPTTAFDPKQTFHDGRRQDLTLVSVLKELEGIEMVKNEYLRFLQTLNAKGVSSGMRKIANLIFDHFYSF